MSNQQQSDVPLIPSLGVFILIVALAIVSSLPSVKKWLTEQVLFWKIVNPLMALVSLYFVYDAFRSKEKILTPLKFLAIFMWTGSRTLVLYEVLVNPFMDLLSALGFLAFWALSLVGIVNDWEFY
jgi:UDP-N-acetylmuramyl pentapeptide phosphotransferase/UDP-N-acetylglucosamine-1-phosphate transferase